MRSSCRYLTRTKHGIWHYQRWPPRYLRIKGCKIFKVSLRTRNRYRAEWLGRAISVKIDRLILDDSLSPEGFGESMRLLKLYLESQTEVSPLEAYEELGLSEDVSEGGKTYHGDEWLLYKGLTLLEKIQKEIEDLANHKDRLEKLIEKGGVGGQRTEDELRAIIESVSVSNVSDEENPVLLDCYQAWVDGDRTASMNRAVGLFVKFVCETKSRGVRLYEVTPADVREYQKFSIALPKGVVVGERSIEELSKIGGSQRSPKTLQDEFS